MTIDIRRNVKRIYTVAGVTTNLAQHCRRYGVRMQIAHARVVDRGWTIEQALGIDHPPPRRYNKRAEDAVVTIPLAPPREIITRVVLGELTGEEYLRLEGVPSGGPRLDDRAAFEVTDDPS